ncbi:MAG: fructose-1,6-bisphosphatase [Firmicutes bacterium]|nr:fructose-1,6-bisphosphatase [Bacillota bacterium]
MEEYPISNDQYKYFKLLKEQFPTEEAVCSEIGRISARLSLPKETEHFMSDIHGEYEAFTHIMNNCSGVIREKVLAWLGGQMTDAQIDEFCTLIYYPDIVLKHLHKTGALDRDWYQSRIRFLLHLSIRLSAKYTRENVRQAMPENWRKLLDELMYYQGDEMEGATDQDLIRRRYHDIIIDALIATQSCDSLIEALTKLIKNLAVEHLHIVGDIFDRGPRAERIMDILAAHGAIDIEWGNHDVLWMGACSGCAPCVCMVLRNSLAYDNTLILERGYGIPLGSLSLTAEKLYPGMPLKTAALHLVNVMLFKLEGQLITRHPEYGMDDRLLLHRMDLNAHTIELDGRTWPLKDLPFPTLDPRDPYALSPEEQTLFDEISHAFRHSIRLKSHISFLYQKGSMYRIYNGNLLYHGCVPLSEDGSFLVKRFDGKDLSGRLLMDYEDAMARRAFFEKDPNAIDFMWYLWCGTDSPLCGREMKTFARAFIPDEDAWEEPRNSYYLYYNLENKCREILEEFGLSGDEAHIINGHMPVKVKNGESPLKAGGRLIVIDGGFCRAYQKTTGIAGYTLISNSHGMRLMAHQPFTSLKDAKEQGQDIHSSAYEFETYPKRRLVLETDRGQVLQERMKDLIQLLEAMRGGQI